LSDVGNAGEVTINRRSKPDSFRTEVVIFFNFKHPAQHLATYCIVVRYEHSLGQGVLHIGARAKSPRPGD
jgi:hypothetical protein